MILFGLRKFMIFCACREIFRDFFAEKFSRAAK